MVTTTLKTGKPAVQVTRKYSEETLSSVLDEVDRAWRAERQASEVDLEKEVHRRKNLKPPAIYKTREQLAAEAITTQPPSTTPNLPEFPPLKFLKQRRRSRDSSPIH